MNEGRSITADAAGMLIAEAIQDLDEGEHERAEAIVRSSLERQPDLPELHYVLGFILQRCGRTAEASDSYGRAVAAGPLTLQEWVPLGIVHGELGHGGVGVVRRGYDQELGRDVAMKFLREEYKNHSALLHRFVEEAQIGAQLQHGDDHSLQTRAGPLRTGSV